MMQVFFCPSRVGRCDVQWYRYGILSYKQMMIYRFSVTSVKIKVIKGRSGALKWMCVARFAAKPTYHPASYRDVHAETEISAQSRKKKSR